MLVIYANNEESGLRYLPPALRDKTGSQQPAGGASGFASSYRRPRAGTLPSNVHLPGNSPIQQQPPPPPRPVLKHSQTVAPPPTSAAGRLRSESLTMLTSPFGAANSVYTTSTWARTGGGGGFSPVEESSDIADQDEIDSATLAYLGLAEQQRPLPATLSELRSQQQQALLAGPQRNRAKTVSGGAFLPTAGLVSRAGLGVMPTQEADEDDYGYDEPAYQSQPALIAKGFKHSQHLAAPTSRPRATSVGDLERLRRPDIFVGGDAEYLSPTSYGGSGLPPPPGLSKSQNIRPSPTVRFPPGSELLRSMSTGNIKPDSPAQVQTPSRSLWIGNLDSSMTSEALIHVFAPYGAIESLRLLPEKECGFVNFVDQADAIRAKEDVLNRLGGNINMPNGQAVRIGFGKADSAPQAPNKSSNSILSPVSPIGGPSGGKLGLGTAVSSGLGGLVSPVTPGGPGGIGESSLQSSPTRALWIGSIPSTTTPATILSVFSPFGPIESARVLTHKNCGFVNFERLDDAVRARKALNGRDVLGSDVGAIRIGFARVPTKNSTAAPLATLGEDEGSGSATPAPQPQGVGDLSVGATIHALRAVKGASAIPADQQVLGGSVENFRSNLLLSMIAAGALQAHGLPSAGLPGSLTPNARATVTEQQLIIRELSAGSPDLEAEVQALADFRPPTTYYTTIPNVSERPHSRRWDASKLRELRKRLDSGNMMTSEIDEVAADFLDGEIVDLASDWLGNTVVQKLFEKCSLPPRVAMLERIAPHLAMIGIHKNGTWAAQKVIDCVATPDEVACVAQNLRPYAPPLLLDQFGNYVIQCCLKFGSPANDFIFDSMCDRLWEIAQGRFGARSMRAILENALTTVHQQRRIATAVILNSIPLATNPNGALLLTWLLDTSGFPARFRLLAPRFVPHLSHLCTHKLASLTVLRIINQKSEPDAAEQILTALFASPGDQVLTDVLGDQVNGVAVVQKILSSTFIEPEEKEQYIEATKRVLTELKVVATQAYRRLIEDLGMPVPTYPAGLSTSPTGPSLKSKYAPHGQMSPQAQTPTYSIPGMPMGYTTTNDPSLASMMASLQLGANVGPNSNQMQAHQQQIQLQVNPGYPASPISNVSGPLTAGGPQRRMGPHHGHIVAPPNSAAAFSPSDPFNPFGAAGNMGMRTAADVSPMPQHAMRPGMPPPRRSNTGPAAPLGQQGMAQAGSPMMGYGAISQPGPGQNQQYMTPQSPVPPHIYQAYMMQGMYPASPPPPNVGAFHS
ncbi:hypothetical protein BKA62DRAFT_764820 [Auriculariales sp. MPI-PUGE-AT-0066]|nr:hypothetical protein BKA62DRAFT_764820 [Auriculariales sp. MPI-PUGE-AT-0066]